MNELESLPAVCGPEKPILKEDLQFTVRSPALNVNAVSTEVVLNL